MQSSSTKLLNGCLILAFSVLPFTSSYAQLATAVQEQSTYSPPSPNASALLQFANIPVNENTGLAAVNLPIDILQGRKLSVPISLGYHASGIKVSDVASSAGLGFSLNAGGLITRVMRGLPDEAVNGYQYTGTKTNGKADSAYLNSVIFNRQDAEPDIFYFNFMGHAGRMVVDTSGNVQYMPDQGVRVVQHPIHNDLSLTTQSWILEDFSGVRYEFGADMSSREVTTVNIQGQPVTKAITYISSWYLVSITSTDQAEKIRFSYNPGPDETFTQYRTMTTYSVKVDVTEKRKFFGGVRRHEDRAVDNLILVPAGTVVTITAPKYIALIQSDIGYVSFTYSPRQDLSGGLSLSTMQTYNSFDNSKALKNYTFYTSYFVSTNPNSQTDPDSRRLRLDCIQLTGRGSEVKQLYSFQYNYHDMLPPRNSDEFDHWGYYTTLDTRQSFPGVNLFVDQKGNLDDGIERRIIDSARMQANILTKVRNMNGGYTEFHYEPNAYSDNGVTRRGGGLRIASTTVRDSLGQIAPMVSRFRYVKDDGSSSGVIYNAKPYYIQGIIGHDHLELKPPNLYLADQELRALKGIAVSSGLALLGHVLAISFLIPNPAVFAIGIIVAALGPIAIQTFMYLFKRVRHYSYNSPPYKISSIPLNNLFDINGASVTYSVVQVYRSGGGSTKDYYTSSDQYPDSAANGIINYQATSIGTLFANSGSYAPNTSYAFERGQLLQSRSYDNLNNLVGQVTNKYALSKLLARVTGIRASVGSYVSTNNGVFTAVTYNTGIYNEVAENIQLVETKTEVFDQVHPGRKVKDIKNYTYESNYPTLVHSITSVQSDATTRQTYYVYPISYQPGTQFIDDLVKSGEIGGPLERFTVLTDSSGHKSIIGGEFAKDKVGGLGLLDTLYRINTQSPIPLANFKPSNQAKGLLDGPISAFAKDVSYKPRTFYQAYDSKNNVSQLQLFGGAPQSTLWDYNGDLPIAQVQNAAIGQIAYTSFESANMKSWTFAASGRDSSSLGKTGKVRYNLASGVIQTTAKMPSGSYILSYWSSGTAAAVGGTSSSSATVSGESDGHGWNYYENKVSVSGSTTVSLTGTGLIDEVRLYPAGSQMVTTTYAPMVGILSRTGANDKSVYYEYDSLARQKDVRDDHYNILQEYSYANVAPVACQQVPDQWVGINAKCYTDQTHIVPTASAYSVSGVNSNGSLVMLFSRAASETGYDAKVDFTDSMTTQATFSGFARFRQGESTASVTIPLINVTADAFLKATIDSVINFTDDYAVGYQRYQNRQRVRDGLVEPNRQTGGLGYFISPTRSTVCNLFTSRMQSEFYKNDCPNGKGGYVNYTVPQGTDSAATQFDADAKARLRGQLYANQYGACQRDTTYLGVEPYCAPGVPDDGIPPSYAYSISTSAVAATQRMLVATVSRWSSESVHDAQVTYQLQFLNGSTVSYSAIITKGVSSINFTPFLSGYKAGDVVAATVTGVQYIALSRRGYTSRQLFIDGGADGSPVPNTQDVYFIAPVADQTACSPWFYNQPQTGFYRGNCPFVVNGLPVAYTVPAHVDSSATSQAEADAIARSTGQVYANEFGTCSAFQPYITTIVFATQIYDSEGLAVDNQGNIYEGSTYTDVIYRVTPDGTKSLLAGNGTQGYRDGPAASAEFSNPGGMAVDNLGNVFVVDDHGVRKIDALGNVTTLTTTSSSLQVQPRIACDNSGNVYFNTASGISKITPSGVITPVAGTTGLTSVRGMKFDSNGNLIVLKGSIYVISPSGTVKTITMTGNVSENPLGIAVDAAGNFYMGNYHYGGSLNNIWTVTPSGTSSILAGQGPYGQVDGPLLSALLNSPMDVAVDSKGNIYVLDAFGSRLRCPSRRLSQCFWLYLCHERSNWCL